MVDDSELKEELSNLRRHFHENPELSDHEFETTKFLSGYLKKLGFKILTFPALKTGVVAEIGPDNSKGVVALRSDTDALPILEETGLDYASKNKGVMHACGHDFHMASLLGAAILFSENKAKLKNKIRLIFQPAEETHNGAQEVIDAGAVKDVKAIIGFHNKPDLKSGEVSILTGGQMAAVDEFNVSIQGKGTHAARPQLGSDPIIALTNIVNTLQTIVSRNEDPLKTTVLSVTHIEGGYTWNVIPEKTWFEGTVRTFSAEARAIAKQRFIDIVEGLSKALDVKAKINWIEGPEVVNNDRELTPLVVEETQKHFKLVDAEPSTAGEDFSFFTNKIPSVFAFIGSEGNSDWHHSDLIVKDDGLITAAKWYYYSALRIQKYFDK